MGYPKQVYERAWTQLDTRAQKARDEHDSMRRKVLESIPEIEHIERQMAALAAQSIYAAASGASDTKQRIESLGHENLIWQERRRNLLQEAGFPADCLDDHFSCKKCRDRGYVDTLMCECLRELLRAEAYAMISDYPDAPQMAGCTFGNFDLSYYSTEPQGSGTGTPPRRRMTDILGYCRSYAEKFSKTSPSLLMKGRTGLGKTFLSLAIAAAVVERGFGVVYTPVQRLCDRLENGKFSYSQDRKERYEQELAGVLECDLLILDDLGTEFISTFSGAAVGNIINSRLLDGRPTIVSTNLELDAIEKQYSQRLASRLCFSYSVLEFIGEDIRYLRRIRRED